MLAMRDGAHPIGPAWLPSAVRDVTALGSTTVLSFLVLVATIFLWLAGRLRTALLLIGATTLGSLAVEMIKALVSRSRPDLVGRLMEETSKSFPSGHAALSAIVYLTLATLLFPVLPDRRIRAFVLVVALVLTFSVGVSRVYLGVHWPSDVAAGWAFGGVWAMLWWRIELALLARAGPGGAQTPRPASLRSQASASLTMPSRSSCRGRHGSAARIAPLSATSASGSPARRPSSRRSIVRFVTRSTASRTCSTEKPRP